MVKMAKDVMNIFINILNKVSLPNKIFPCDNAYLEPALLDSVHAKDGILFLANWPSEKIFYA